MLMHDMFLLEVFPPLAFPNMTCQAISHDRMVDIGTEKPTTALPDDHRWISSIRDRSLVAALFSRTERWISSFDPAVTE